VRVPHDHHHHHVALDGPKGDRNLVLAIAVNLGLTVAQVIGGILSGSLALVADALHNLSDALSLVIAALARRVARKPADAGMTFGYARAETVAALINYTTLIVLGLYLCSEAIMRLLDPQPVAGWTVVIIAGIALVVDLVTAGLTFAMARDSQNIRAAFLHNLADAAGSIGVIVAGVGILAFDWWIIDPIVTLLIAGSILWLAFREIGGVIRVLMLGTPPDLDTEDVLNALAATDGVTDVHHAHLWQMDEHRPALQAHLVLSERDWARSESIRNEVKLTMQHRFGIRHVTLELESCDFECPDRQRIGHD